MATDTNENIDLKAGNDAKVESKDGDEAKADDVEVNIEDAKEKVELDEVNVEDDDDDDVFKDDNVFNDDNVSNDENVSDSSSSHREALLATYNNLQQQRKELRNRSLKAQNTIVNYLRHNRLQLSLGAQYHDMSGLEMRREYDRLLSQLLELKEKREQLQEKWTEQRSGLASEVRNLNVAIAARNSEMNAVKSAVANRVVDPHTGKTINQKDLLEHSLHLDSLESSSRPLRRRLVLVQSRLDELQRDFQPDDNAHIELALEKQVYSVASARLASRIKVMEGAADAAAVRLAHLGANVNQLESRKKELGDNIDLLTTQLREVRLARSASSRRRLAHLASVERDRLERNHRRVEAYLQGRNDKMRHYKHSLSS